MGATEMLCVQIGAKITPGDRDELLALAETSGRSLSSLVGDAIAIYLGKNQPASLAARLQECENRLDALEKDRVSPK